MTMGPIDESVVWLLRYFCRDKNDVNPFVEDATVAQKIVHKEEKMKDFKILYLIHQYVNVDNFENVDDCTSSRKLKKFWRKVMHDLIRQRW